VSDYTYQLALALSRRTDEEVHIWAPECCGAAPAVESVLVHRLPSQFGLRWLLALDRLLPGSGSEEPIIVQYVPHSYGWKAMNLGLCLWLFGQRRRRRFFVMFHEVAYPFLPGQPLKHHVLAAVHRIMAWIVLHSAERSFTSIEPYRKLLNRLAPNIPVELSRICSNVPFKDWQQKPRELAEFKKVGVFSNFRPEICNALEPVALALLANPSVHLQLIGPGSSLVHKLHTQFPKCRDQVSTTGRVPAIDVGPYLQACDVLLQIYPEGAVGARGTLIAALASGVPVVTTAGKLTEPIFETCGGVVLADDDPTAIRRAVECLLTDQNLARRIGTAGRRLYNGYFDIAVTAARLQALSTKALHPMPRVFRKSV
jgi:glycosyltransferase involved in cell wall biosynthesis